MQGDELRMAFTALTYHEMSHVFQPSRNYTAPGSLTEGIADYMVLRANLNETGKPVNQLKPSMSPERRPEYITLHALQVHCTNINQVVGNVNKSFKSIILRDDHLDDCSILLVGRGRLLEDVPYELVYDSHYIFGEWDTDILIEADSTKGIWCVVFDFIFDATSAMQSSQGQ
ncbi:hypothetical protein RJ640_018639 [Escallonia rubra]|uniref:Uncharacterized protein n=1 Tax=Escallonia rubra TaxID=112253 RepID=A0AA88U7R5_9ASTE|nr:hypothetical protein RJ640_018639 [Escallonia rubra]